jgi:hypothetical protein
MSNLKGKINELDDVQVVRFFEHFGQQLFAGMDVSVEQIKDGIPDSIRAIPGFSDIENLSPDQAERLISPSESAALARNTLLILADDETLAPLVETALESYSDNEMVVDVILAVGFVASMLMITATTQVEGQMFGIKFKKSKADAKLVRAITEPFANALSTFSKP